MFKKSLLSGTAAVAIMLFSTHFSAYATVLSATSNEEVKDVSDDASEKNYDAIKATNSGKIIGKDIKVTAPESEKTGVTSTDLGSEITLKGTTTIEKAVDGILAKTGGKITSEDLKIKGDDTGTGVTTTDPDSTVELTGTTTIEKVANGFRVNKGSKVTAKNVTIILPEAKEDSIGILVDGANSVIELTGQTTIKDIAGSGLRATTGGKLVSKDLTITGSQNEKNTNSTGIAAYLPNTMIELTGKTTIENMVTGLYTAVGSKIVSENLTITGSETEKKSTGAKADNNSVITLKGTTTIEKVANGLDIQNAATVKMTDGSITASQIGALFNASGNDENKNTLENVKISSSKDDALIDKGISAEKSTVSLNNVTVTKATTGIFANNNSTITVSGGSFDGKTDGVYAKEGSAITLDEKTAVTSSDGYGLHAEGPAKITKTKGAVSGKQAALFAEKGGQIDATDVALTTTDDNGTGAKADGADSVITLKGTTTIEKVANGLDIQNTATASMTGGSIKASQIGALFNASGNDENKNTLDNVKISSSKDDALIDKGISAEKSTVSLNNVTVTQANTGIFANDHSTITVSGGSFDGKTDGVYAKEGSAITLDEKAAVTSSDGYGLHAEGPAKITKTKGAVSGKQAALFAEKGGQIDATDVALTTTDDNGTGAKADGADSVITLKGTTTIEKVANGLDIQNTATASMTGGSIKASQIGALFNASGNDENKNTLDNVKISSSKDDALIDKGISAEKSTVSLNNVTVTQANTGIFANDHSTITVSGGSFDSKQATIFAQNGSTITINDSKITSSDNTGLRAKDNGTIKMTKGKVKGGIYAALTAENGGHINVIDVSLSVATGGGAGANASGPNSMIELHGTEIDHAFLGLYAEKNAIIKMTGGTITTSTVGATFYDSKNNENKLEDVTISSSQKDETVVFTGLNSQASNVTLKNVHITNAKFGVYAMDHSKIKISGGSFVGNDIGINAESGSTIALTDDTKITSSNGYGLHASGLDSTITMTKGNITGKEAALTVENGGQIDATNIFATAERNGIKFENPEEDTTSEINLTNAKLHIKNGIGINVDESTGTVNLGKKSEIRADVLLVTKASAEENDLAFTLNSDNSILEGRAKVINSPKTIFNLQNNTQWIVKTSTNEKDDDGNLLDIAQRSRSDVSVLNLNNSSIVFEKPTEDHYQTLHIGSGKPDTQEVYNATDDAKIYFNAEWSDGAAINDQKTDRLLIHGDISGTTSVYVTGRLEENNIEANTSAAANIRGLSLIQVSGKAEENSFKLVNGYTTRDGLPDMYTLRAYGPESSHGQADVAQNLFDEKNEKFWDFRLQPELLGSNSGSNPDPETNIPTVALVPQTASYLVMPNALFYSGLTDMAKQNALLANIRTSVLGKEEEKQTGFFLYTYGSTGTLSSERGPLKYGYGADIRYTALQAGVTLAAIEGQNTTTHFGLVGTYGQLSFTPKDMKDAGKNTLNKWAITAYGSIQ
uniref:right-handed parallel beta-helix repeat-containing protein n=5 Tax=Bartonella TaxID=773 RepID=UPI0035D1350D